MSQAIAQPRPRGGISGVVEALNTRYHKISLRVFIAIVLAHWAEHLVQAFQVFVLGWERPASRGVLGQFFPFLVESEALHYGYAIVMLAGLLLFLPGFVGKARTWWIIAIVIQFWHHIEHALLLGQASVNANLFGQEVPTSFAQLVVERVELHLLYNGLVTIPMIVAMVLHIWPPAEDRHKASCSCEIHAHDEVESGVTRAA
jgi:hypothetical protein